MGSKSTTSQVQTQQEIVDSYNTTTNQVLNLADVGNVKINIPEVGAESGSGLSPMTIGLVGAGLVAAVLLFRK